MHVQVTDYRTQFSKWWVSEWKAVAFPEKGLVFDYYVDETQVGWLGACVWVILGPAWRPVVSGLHVCVCVLWRSLCQC